jgi:hypothetical protein
MLLLLDFEKVFDKISWKFLKATMAKLGFDFKWISWVMCLYNGAFASIELNKTIHPTFNFQPLVCQGCPMAPYFFCNKLPHELRT